MKLLVTLIAIMTVVQASHAFAGSGKTVLPFVCGGGGARTDVYLINISGHDLAITAKGYYLDGSDATNSISYLGLVNTNELQPNHRGTIVISNATGGCETLEIYWNDVGTNHSYYGLIGNALYYNSPTTTYMGVIQVNQGLPF